MVGFLGGLPRQKIGLIHHNTDAHPVGLHLVVDDVHQNLQQDKIVDHVPAADRIEIGNIKDTMGPAFNEAGYVESGLGIEGSLAFDQQAFQGLGQEIDIVDLIAPAPRGRLDQAVQHQGNAGRRGPQTIEPLI